MRFLSGKAWGARHSRSRAAAPANPVKLADMVFGHLPRGSLVNSALDAPLDGVLGEEPGPSWIGNVWGSSGKSWKLWLGIGKSGLTFSACCLWESHKDNQKENNWINELNWTQSVPCDWGLLYTTSWVSINTRSQSVISKNAEFTTSTGMPNHIDDVAWLPSSAFWSPSEIISISIISFSVALNASLQDFFCSCFWSFLTTLWWIENVLYLPREKKSLRPLVDLLNSVNTCQNVTLVKMVEGGRS